MKWAENIKSFFRGDSTKGALSSPDEVVVLDTESSGLDEHAHLLSFAGIRIQENRLLADQSLNIYVKQAPSTFTKDAIRIHGITGRKMEEEGIPLQDALVQIYEFIEDTRCVGHHISFDIMLLNKHFTAEKMEPLSNPDNGICTAALAKRLERPAADMMPSYALEEVCTRYRIPIHARHTAAGDAYSTALLWLKLRNEALKRKIRL